MDKALLVSNLRQRMFADRGTDVAAAWEYCNMMIDSIPGGNEKIAARTALHVLANTVANAIEALPEHIEFLPEPPAEVNIKGMPMTLSLDRATLDQIIDERIQNWYEHEFDIQEEVNGAINEYDFEETVRDIVKHNITFSIDVD
jgi:hypothetical protein